MEKIEIKVTKTNISLTNGYILNQGEYQVDKCKFTFSEEYEDLVKKAVFVNGDTSIDMVILNDECDIPYEILQTANEFTLKVYGYQVQDEELIQRYSPTALKIFLREGSYVGSNEVITPSQFEQYEQALHDGLEEVNDKLDEVNQAITEANNLDVEIDKVDKTTTITLTKKDGTTEEVEILDGEDGIDGKDAKINGYNTVTIAEGTNIEILQEGSTMTINNTYSYDDSSILADINNLQTNKADKSEIPTKTSDLENNSGYIDNTVNNLVNYTTTTNMNSAISNAVGVETTNRQNADINLQGQIDAITSASDVVDVVGTYEELEEYDTSKLTDKDVIKVMQDSTHSNAISYYRWNTSTFEYVGSEGPFYTKGETDTLLSNKVGFTDYATSSVGGVIKSNSNYGTNVENSGNLKGVGKNYTEYQSASGNLFISKSTLEAVITGKQLESQTNKVTSLSSSSTDTQYPSAKAVYTKEQETKADLENQLEETNAQLDQYKKIFNALPKVNGSGEEITLDNTAETPLKMELSGNTSQFSTTGKNMLNVASDYSVTGNVQIPITIPTGTEFKITLDSINLGGENKSLISFRDANGSPACPDSLLSPTDLSYTRTTTAEVAKVYIYSQNSYNNSVGITTKFKNLMVSLNGGDYEPYTGSNPSPSPDYPQEVEVVSGDNEVVVCGKNLNIYPYKDTTTTNRGITYTDMGDGTINVNGTATGGTSYFNMTSSASDKPIKLKAGTYTASLGRSSNVRATIANYYNATEVVTTIPTNTSSSTFTINEDKEVSFLLAVNNGLSLSNVLIEPQLEKSSTATEYEPYQSQTYNLSLGNIELCKIGDYQDDFRKSTGKNLLPNDTQTQTIRNVTYTNENGYIKVDGTANGGNADLYFVGSDTNYVDLGLEAGTYNLSGVSDGSTDTYMLYMVINRNGNLSYYQSVNTNGLNISIQEGDTFRIFIRVLNGVSVSNKYVYPMLEKGSQATEYEPYGIVWCKHKEIGKVVLDGSESSWFKSSSTIIDRFVCELQTGTLSNYSNVALSNYFTYNLNTSSQENIGEFYLYSSGSNTRLFMDYSTYNTTTLEQFKTWLGTHNTNVYYVLATPTNEAITDTTLINQLNAIEKAYAYQNQTNISQQNNDKPFVIDAETVRDLSNIFDI